MTKKIGILGGMSPESTSTYYEYITRTYTERFGDFSYPEIIIYSVSFQPFVDWPSAGRWDLVANALLKVPTASKKPAQTSLSSPPIPCISFSMKFRPR